MTTKKATSEYISNPFTLSFRAFGNLTQYNMGWFVALLIIEVLNISSSILNEPTVSSESGGLSASVVALVSLLVLAALVIAFVVSVYFYGMFSYVSLQSAAGKSVRFKEAFNETKKRFAPLALGLLNAGVRVIGGLLLFIVPGIRAILRYTVLPYIIMSQPAGEVSGADAVARSKAITKSRLMEVLGVVTMNIIPLIGSSLTIAGEGALYNQLAKYHDKKLEKPKIHWLNYIGFIIAGVGILVIMAIFAILASVGRTI